MEYGYSILMGIFSAGILFYAGLMAVTKDYNMLPYRARQSVKPKDPEKYTSQLAKVVALTALSPALSALAGLWYMGLAFILLIGFMIFFLWLGTRIMKGIE